MKKEYAVCADRRKALLQSIMQQGADTNSLIVLCAGFENERYVFRPESSFYYLTGIADPDVVITIDMHGDTTLYCPDYTIDRTIWTSTKQYTPERAEQLGIDTIETLGNAVAGYSMSPLFTRDEVVRLLQKLESVVQSGGTIYTPLSGSSRANYIDQQMIIDRLCMFCPDLQSKLISVAPHIASLRRKKSQDEIAMIQKAIDITITGFNTMRSHIIDDIKECELKGLFEASLRRHDVHTAFPTIVAGGKNGTILHYTQGSGTVRNDDLVVIDAGAEYGYYSADITRTYPVAGTFNDRQRMLYQLVLDTQHYVAQQAKPGVWLRNNNRPQESLHHMALEFLHRHGYDQYFPHGIGHFLGLDTHDVGDYSLPLQEGDVITIEPGIYIPKESIGIRIEDDYLITSNGVTCLSSLLSKDIQSVEQSG